MIQHITAAALSVAAALAAPLAAAPNAAPQEPRTAIVQLPEAHVATGTMMVDIDGDGATDLVLACRNDTTGQRSLRIHLRQQGRRVPAFASAPSSTPIAIDRDVVAFTFCNCTPGPAADLVLFTPERAVMVLAGKDGAPAYRPLFRHRLVWPAAQASRVVPLPDAAVDFDGDGRTDLVLPSPNAWVVHFQDRKDDEATFTRRAERTLPSRQDQIQKAVKGRGVAASTGSLELRLGAGMTNRNGGPLVRTSTRTPQCEVVDLDGDGKPDLAMHRNGKQYSGRQNATAKLEPNERELPLPPNRLKLIDPAFDVQWPDIDGNGTADLLLTTSAQRDDNVEARVDTFLTRSDGSWPEKPNARLRMQALARPPQIVDADGDGQGDLVCVTLRTSTMSTLTGGKSGSFDSQLNIFGGNGKQFAKPALLSLQVSLTTNSSLARPFAIVRPGRRGRAGDVLLHIGDRIERRFLNRKAGKLSLAASDAHTQLPKNARIALADPLGDEILILAEGEVRHVRFRR